MKASPEGCPLPGVFPRSGERSARGASAGKAPELQSDPAHIFLSRFSAAGRNLKCRAIRRRDDARNVRVTRVAAEGRL